MLVNDDFLFIHYPKTAGKSLTKYFVSAWDGPIYGRVGLGQLRELADVMRPDVFLEVGRGHENMHTAQTILANRGQCIQDMRAVLVCIRNPYDIAVSTYFFMREKYKDNRHKDRFQFASEQTFEEFWCNDESDGPPERWFTLYGEVLSNQRFIRFEDIHEDLKAISEKFGFGEATLPHLNSSNRGHYSEYITARSEEAIYRKFKWLFETGYYSRESFE